MPREPLIPLMKEYLGFLTGLLKGIYRGWLKLYRASQYDLSYIPELRGIGLSGWIP